MATKTFNVGEYGYHPKIKVKTGKHGAVVQMFGWDGKLDDQRSYSFDSLNHLELDLAQDSTDYYANKIVTWVMATKDYKASFKEPDPFTTYSFSFHNRMIG